MKKILYLLLVLFFVPVLGYSQFYTENFESADSLNLPQGWSKWNNLPFPVNMMAVWTVRDSGLALPNLSTALSKAYDGKRSAITTWGSSIPTDTSTGLDLSDSWLVTKQFRNIPNDCALSFYAFGGTTAWADSIQIRVSTTDSLPASFTNYVATIIWPSGSIYGNFQNYLYDLSMFGGQNIRIAFRYYCDAFAAGFSVTIDKVQLFGTIGIKEVDPNIPKEFDLKQNYPNPFNPSTTIRFDLAKNTNVKLEVYNSIGQLVSKIYEGYKNAGTYESVFYSMDLPSGVYYYHLTTDYYSATKKMILVK